MSVDCNLFQCSQRPYACFVLWGLGHHSSATTTRYGEQPQAACQCGQKQRENTDSSCAYYIILSVAPESAIRSSETERVPRT